ncbi:MAG: multidrug ABC transporter substrate-binding protein [Caulobacterales bacterium 32-69-10]|nr:MAG: multidrug ABC transporter substrate-binding protein [Caulobacterales bacterium 32-69-10]
MAAGAFAGWERSLAARYLRAKRKQGGVAMISIISFIGITLAVAVLVIVMAVMNGFRTELLARTLGFNGHVFVRGPVATEPYAREALIQRLRAVPGVVQAIPVVEAQGLVSGPAQVGGGIIRGMRREDVAATPIITEGIKQGSLRGFGQGEYGGDIVLVGARLAENLGLRAGDAISIVSPNGGATILGSTPRRKTYTVGAVFSVGMSEFDAAYIYMPLEQAQLFFGRDQSVDLIEIKLADADAVEQIRPLIERAAGNGTVVSDWRDTNHSFFNALQVERTTMRLILFLIVAVAVMNITSGLIMLVKNKSRDIAILRTMGASQGSILRIFFMSGAAIGFFGTVTGVVLGALFCIYIDQIQTAVETITGVAVFSPDTYFLARIPARIEWGEVAIISIGSLVMTFIATLPQAFHASHLDPVEALRNE